MAENKVKLESTSSRYSNLSDDGRVFNISADVRMDEGMTPVFSNGNVQKREDVTFGFGTFNCSDSNFNCNFNNYSQTEAKDAVDAILAFVNDVKDEISLDKTA